MSRKHDSFKDWLYFLYSWKIFLIARNTLFLITKAFELILFSIVLLAKPLEELSNLQLPRNLLGNPLQLPDNALPALLKEQCTSRLVLALQSFLALLQSPPSKYSAPLVPLAASSYHPHSQRTQAPSRITWSTCVFHELRFIKTLQCRARFSQERNRGRELTRGAAVREVFAPADEGGLAVSSTRDTLWCLTRLCPQALCCH